MDTATDIHTGVVETLATTIMTKAGRSKSLPAAWGSTCLKTACHPRFRLYADTSTVPAAMLTTIGNNPGLMARARFLT